MMSVTELFFGLLRYLGLLVEHPMIIRNNIKRNRVFDDFSSDDETPLMGYKQNKKFRWSDVELIDNYDKPKKLVKTRSFTSTHTESSKRTVPAVLPPLLRKGQSTQKKTTPAKPLTDVHVALKDPKVAKVKSKSEITNKKAPILHVDLDDDDNDEVVFVKEVATPPNEQPLKPIEGKNSLPGANDRLLSILAQAINSDEPLAYREVLQRMANTIKSMSKKETTGDSNLARNTASYRPPQETQLNVLNKIELDNQVNADRHQNTPQECVPIIRVSLTDSSDSDDDVEIVPNSTTTSSIKTNSTNKLKELSRIWLELNSIYNEEKADDASRVSDITSKVNSGQNRAHSDGHDETDASEELLSKLASDYIRKLHSKRKIQKTQEKNNESRMASDITPNENNRQNQAASSKRETVGDWLAKMDANYFSTLIKIPDKLDVHQEPNIVPKVSDQNEALSYKPKVAEKIEPLPSQKNLNTRQVNTVQKETRVSPLESTREWLNKLEAQYFPNCRNPNIVPKVNSIQNDVHSINLNTAGVLTLRKGSEYKTDFQKTQETHDDARRESDSRPKANSTENEARSYLPASSRDWLSQLDAKYKTSPEIREILDNARKRLNNVSEVNSKENETRSLKPRDILDNERGRLNNVLEVYSEDNKTRSLKSREILDTARKRLNNVSQVNGEENETRSLKPREILDNARKRLNNVSDVNSEANETRSLEPREILDNARKRLNNVSMVNSKENETRSHKPESTDDWIVPIKCKLNRQESSNENKPCRGESVEVNKKRFKFNTSDELLSKLGSLYDTYQQEKEENSNKSEDENDVETQPNEVPELVPLTPEQDQLVDRAFEPEPEDELLIEKFNMRIHRRDLQTLSDLNWLNDEVINFYMNLIMQRSEEREDLPKIYATNTFFYLKLMQSGHAGLRRWTRKVDIFAYDLFIVPVNLGQHWCLAIVDFRTCEVNYLDSQGLPNQECLDALMKYLKHEHQDKKGVPFDDRGWSMEHVTDIPQQMNGSDCGMFACTFAEFTSRDAAYSFTQAHMPYLRRKAALEILMGKLLL